MAWEAWAGSPAEQLKHSVDKAIKVLQDPALKADAHLAERQAAIRKIANETFDFAETAKRSLPNAGGKEPSVRRSSSSTDLWDRSDFFKIDQYGGEQIIYLDELLDGDQATVQTKIITKQGTEVPVDYRMLRRGDRWLVYDMLIGAVSLISNYRFSSCLSGVRRSEVRASANHVDVVARDNSLGQP